MYHLAAASIAQKLCEVKAVILKVGGFVDSSAAEATVGETLHGHEVGVKAAQQLDRGCYQNTFGIVAEFIIYPHTVEFAHPRFRVGVREYPGFGVLHVAVDGHSEATVGFVGAEDSEVVDTETSVISFVGVVVLDNHFLCGGLINRLYQKPSERGGLLVNLRGETVAVSHSA